MVTENDFTDKQKRFIKRTARKASERASEEGDNFSERQKKFISKTTVDEGFTQKEMLIRILDKLEKMDVKMNETHELASKTNGKVQIQTKAIYALGGALVTIAGWLIYISFSI